ncbi:MAG: hypothetical protein K2Q18_08380 [Bdellovibrionales bacterium]|nr:hypothetical protein [Bdellovibrionales bacterium]
MKIIKIIFFSLLILVVFKCSIFYFNEINLSCNKEPSTRGQEVCEIMKSKMSWHVNGHTFTPQFILSFDQYKEVWCKLKITEKDTSALKNLEKHSKMNLSYSASMFLTLIQAERDGKIEDSPQTGTIFDPKFPSDYVLKGKCQ